MNVLQKYAKNCASIQKMWDTGSILSKNWILEILPSYGWLVILIDLSSNDNLKCWVFLKYLFKCTYNLSESNTISDSTN